MELHAVDKIDTIDKNVVDHSDDSEEDHSIVNLNQKSITKEKEENEEIEDDKNVEYFPLSDSLFSISNNNSEITSDEDEI